MWTVTGETECGTNSASNLFMTSTCTFLGGVALWFVIRALRARTVSARSTESTATLQRRMP